MTGNITVNTENDIDVAFKNCARLSACKTQINDTFIDQANLIHITMSVCNLIEYSDNYSDISGSLWQFKRDEVPVDNANLTTAGSESFKYKASLVGRKTANVDNGNSFVKNVKKAVPLKYISNFRRSLEMPLINCKVHLQLNWIEEFILSSAGNSTKFKVTNAKLDAPIVTLSTKDNVKLARQLSD